VIALVPIALGLIEMILNVGGVQYAIALVLYGEIRRAGMLILLSTLGSLLLSPATASGYGALLGMAARLGQSGEGAGGGTESGAAAGQPNLRVFTANLGTYYTKIAIMGLLTGAAMFVVYWFLGLTSLLWSLAPLVSLLVAFMADLWFAAVVLEGAGHFDALGRAWRSLTSRLGEYLPVLVLGVAAGYVVPRVLQLLFGMIPATGWRYRLGALVITPLMAIIGCVVRLAVFQIYRSAPAAGSGSGGGERVA
jgi:hypothetical protein